MSHPKYSVIIPVYNRPQEVDELLQSLLTQTYQNFEVLLIEDGSTKSSVSVFEAYSGKLNLYYFFKPNSGPGPSRNFGFERATGEYFVVFDSDCIVPPHYFESVERHLSTTPLDAWGGPDRGKENFTMVQRAMAYTMSSFLTTGGIRGGSSAGFQPRSFNMGLSKIVFEKTGGFKFERFAEDIELSVRMVKAGFRVGLIPEAFVYHKRRTNFMEFFRQVSNFGKGRVLVGRVHPHAIKLTHWFPTAFLAALFLIPMGLFFGKPLSWFAPAGFGIYLAAIGFDAAFKTKSLAVALLSIPSAMIQLTGYGWGFLKEMAASGTRNL